MFNIANHVENRPSRSFLFAHCPLFSMLRRRMSERTAFQVADVLPQTWSTRRTNCTGELALLRIANRVENCQPFSPAHCPLFSMLRAQASSRSFALQIALKLPAIFACSLSALFDAAQAIERAHGSSSRRRTSSVLVKLHQWHRRARCASWAIDARLSVLD